MAKTSKEKFEKRKSRVRFALKSKNNGRLRLSVFRSTNNIYAQVIDDEKGQTVVSASTLEKGLVTGSKSNIAAAEIVGKNLAERLLKKEIAEVVFDRGAYMYHGRVKALAEAAKAAGLKF